MGCGASVKPGDSGPTAPPCTAPPKSMPGTSAGSGGASHVAVVGAGFVGTSASFTLLCGGVGSLVTLTDIVQEKVEGEVMDLEDTGGAIRVASMQEAGQADVIVITAGRGQRPGETRLDLIEANAGIMRSVAQGMQPINPNAKIICVSNPCDPLTYCCQQHLGLPQNQVFGSGTLLDSIRLRVALGKKLGLHHSALELTVLGEHGDSQFAAFSMARVGGIPLIQFAASHGITAEQLHAESQKSRGKAYEIIQRKKYTAFGIGSAIVSITDAILHDRRQVLPVSVRVPGRECCASLPAVLGRNGVEQILDPTAHLDAKEKTSFENACKLMEESIASLRKESVA